MTRTTSDDENGGRLSSSGPLSAAKIFGAEPVRSARPPVSDSEQPPSGRFDGEDFLFHLYRGSELLQDNCVEQAKEELERALRMQPRDIEGQGLLGVVYFRLGMYPRAIEIYREIVKECPDEVTPKLNLALCYFKTGQPSEARDMLEDVIRRVPDHPRAWGYLGLVFERLGEYSKAEGAFERAGQPHLGRRMRQLLDQLSDIPDHGVDLPSDEVRRAAADAALELDAGSAEAEPPFLRAESASESAAAPAGRWTALEPGEEPLPALSRQRRPSLIGRFGPAVPAVPDPTEIAPAGGAVGEPAPAEPARAAPSGRPSGPLSPEALVTRRYFELEGRAARTREGLVLVNVHQSLALRAERLRAVSQSVTGLRQSTFKRRLRGRDSEEPFGGAGSSWVLLEGMGRVVLEPSSERELVLLQLNQDFVYLRENRIVAFDGLVRHENGRLPAADPGPVPMVQLAGDGVVVFEAYRSLVALPVAAERPLNVRSSSVLGWTGRLLGQAPGAGWNLGAGFVAFSGDGAVLVDEP